MEKRRAQVGGVSRRGGGVSSSTTMNINSNRLNSGTFEKQHFHAEQAEQDRLSGASGSRDTTHNPPASRLAGKRPVAMETLTPAKFGG